MPEFRSVAATFLVADVGATARWYCDKLGFRATFFPKSPPYSFASLQRDGVEIMLLGLTDYRKPDLSHLRPEGLWDAYIRMRGIRNFYDQAAGTLLLQQKLVKRPYGDWEFEVRDPNGYVLVFAELTD
jgi:catechol 2,3-dioxygenase-like lactoylglutathione lyase family enzyme